MRVYAFKWRRAGDEGGDDDRMGDHEGRERLVREGIAVRESGVSQLSKCS